MKETKTNVMRILEKEKIDYEAKFYPHGKEAVDLSLIHISEPTRP